MVSKVRNVRLGVFSGGGCHHPNVILSGCSSHDQLLDKFGADSLPEISGSLTPAVLTGVLAWISWLSENNIVGNSGKLVGMFVFAILSSHFSIHGRVS